MTDIRLAYGGPPAALQSALGAQDQAIVSTRGLPIASLPAILVSYVYWKQFAKLRSGYRFRDIMLDSGAFSAWKSGKVIDLAEYIAFCKVLRSTDAQLAEVIGLDVIGDARGSLANAVTMRDAGMDAMPVFHVGDDWGILREYCDGWSKVGLSCRFGEPIKESYKFYDQCFAKAWPKKFHSFGWVAREVVLRYPFHSADCSSWELGPCGFGAWKFLGKVSVRGGKHDLRSQVLWYLELEAECRLKWGPLFERVGWTTGPDVRLALSRTHVRTKGMEGSYG